MQLTKKLIPFAMYTLIALVVLTPQRASSQFSDSTIREINERLIELHECRKKQELYIKLAKQDSTQIMNQASIITNQEQTIAKEKSKNKTLQKINAVQFALLVLALII
tara:strand:+ start:1311 stop:1634 length:324 start_codon:yes stop_codon:yes gene_type:complete